MYQKRDASFRICVAYAVRHEKVARLLLGKEEAEHLRKWVEKDVNGGHRWLVERAHQIREIEEKEGPGDWIESDTADEL